MSDEAPMTEEETPPELINNAERMMKELVGNSKYRLFDKPEYKWLIWNHQLIINGYMEKGFVMGLRRELNYNQDKPTVQVIVSNGGETTYYTLLCTARCYLLDYDPNIN